jgi:hypothetical protein
MVKRVPKPKPLSAAERAEQDVIEAAGRKAQLAARTRLAGLPIAIVAREVLENPYLQTTAPPWLARMIALTECARRLAEHVLKQEAQPDDSHV